MHRHSPPGKRERDPAGPDAELERGSAAGELGQELGDRVDGRRLEQLRHRPVVPLGDALVEVPVAIAHRGIAVPSNRNSSTSSPSNMPYRAKP